MVAKGNKKSEGKLNNRYLLLTKQSLSSLAILIQRFVAEELKSTCNKIHGRRIGH